MSSSWWSRLPALVFLVGALARGRAAVQRGRTATAARIRKIVPGIRHVFVFYCGLLVLLGMITAGLVVLPVGLVLLLQGLLRDSVDRNVVGGMLLCLVGLFYLVAPVLIIHTLTHYVSGRWQRYADSLADRLEGKP